MTKKKNAGMFFSDFLYWCPRILAILITVFISIFSLDSFSQGYGFFEALIAFAIHLMPVYTLILAAKISWKNETEGGLLFVLFGIWVFLFSQNQAAIAISGGLFLTGMLFLFNRFIK